MEPIEGESVELQSIKSGRERLFLERTSDPEPPATSLYRSNTASTNDDPVETEYIHDWTLGLVMFALLMSYFLVALDLVCILSLTFVGVVRLAW